jgi:para-nitrobenzyl esterase
MTNINRRTVTAGLAAAGLAAFGADLCRAESRTSPSAGPTVKTRSGSLQGVARDGVAAFLGVPYGAPTGDAGRFLPPRPPAPWSGIRTAVAYGAACPQIPLGVSPFANKHPAPGVDAGPTPMQRELGTLFTHTAADDNQGEDCLVLNIWTPATGTGKRPVMVWLHGGGFAVGSGSHPQYDGTRMAKRGDVVVVTINHRLNVFGYLYLAEIAGDAFAQSGNVGMLDVVAALAWVRDNIQAFGGDPHNVTIFGESGGAGKVSVVCAMPAARGLFHRAIMQSGPCLTIQNKDRGTAIARQLLDDLGIAPRQISRLQTMDARQLAAAAAAAEVKVVPRVLGFGPMGLIPLVDGSVLTHDPFDPVAAPESAALPFLVGSTKDEATLFAGPLPQWGHFTEAEVVERLKPLAVERAQQAFDLYRRLHPADSPSYLLADAVTDFWMRQAANRVAELKTRQGKAPAFVYVLDWELNSTLRTPHGTDVPLVFDNVASSPAAAAAPGAQALADQMTDAWVAFARSGNPGTAALPHWPPYSLDARPTMAFNLQSRVIDDYGSEARRFWEA